MAKQERAERTRSNILDAAAEVFDERGFSGASLSDILAKAGVTKGALYFHFSSKDDLAKALVDAQYSVENTSGIAEDGGMQAVIDMSHAMAHSMRSDVRIRASMRLVVEANFSNPTPHTYRRWIDVLTTLLSSAQASGDLRKELSPADAANWVSASFLGIWTQSEVLCGMADLHDRVTDLWTIALPGLVPPRRLARFTPTGTTGSYGAVA